MRTEPRLLAALCLLAVLAAAAPAHARTVRDEIGRSVRLQAVPQRIVALTPSLVEIVFGLGLGQRLVGATTWADYPAAARRVPRVGSYVSPNMELIVAAKPDLVLANREGNPTWVVDKLTEAGIPVYVTWPHDPLGLPDSLARLGALLGAPEAGARLASEMRASFRLVKQRLAGAKPVKTLLVLGSHPLVSVAPHSYSGRLLALAGARNVAPDGSGQWPRLDPEYVIGAAPEVVIVSSMERGQNLGQELDYWKRLPGLAGRPGYRVTHIISDIIDRPGPRLGRGLESLAALVHPERFPEAKERP